MRLFLPSLSVEDEEGFTSENDLFNRATLGKGLTNLVTSVDQSLVIAIDAQWGSGKTTFLKMWAGELRKLGLGVIFFDAFQNDYADDAFTSIAAQIITLTRDKNKEKDGRVKKFTEKALGASKILARSAIKIGVKAGTAGLLDAEDLHTVAKDTADELSGVTDKYLGEMLTKQKEQQITLDEFRKSLGELPELLYTAKDGFSPQRRPLVIIIDELDRCRPSYALEILERVKHFFAVDNVHFVLGVHLNQLENSVKASYGGDIDAKTYLQKFISLPILLVDTGQRHEGTAVKKFSQYASRSLDIDDRDEFYASFVSHVAQHRDLPFRTIEKIFTNIAMTLAFSSERTLRPNFFVAGLSVLRVTHPRLFIKAKLGTLKFEEVVEPLALGVESNELGRYMDKIVDYYKLVTHVELDPALLRELMSPFSRYNIRGREDILPHVAKNVMDRFLPPAP